MSEAKFNKAADIIKNLQPGGSVHPSSDDKLAFYSLYNQATIGDVNTTRPGMLHFNEKVKWDAWNNLRGTSKEDARGKYIKRVTHLLEGIENEETKKWLGEIEAVA